MARNLAIAATSSAIVQLLTNAAAASEWSAAQVTLFQADDLAAPVDAAKAKVSIYLHRVVMSSARRDRGPRIDRSGQRFRPSIPVDLHYLVTAWSTHPETAQRLLGWAIGVLNDTSVIPVGVLNAYDVAPVFEPDETVELVWEPLSITDLYNVWQVAADKQRPSASYLARSVRIDSEAPIEAGSPVHVREFRYVDVP